LHVLAVFLPHTYTEGGVKKRDRALVFAFNQYILHFLIHIQREIQKCGTEMPFLLPWFAMWILLYTEEGLKKVPPSSFSLYIQRHVLEYATELFFEMKGGKQESISMVSRKK